MKPIDEWIESGYITEHVPETVEERKRRRAELIRAIQTDAEQSGYLRGFNEGRKQGMADADKIVETLAESFVGNEQADGTRSTIVYEQGIGCERAHKAILEAMNKLP